MIRKPQGYDEAPAYTGESVQLPKGKYICVIKQVTTQKSQNGNDQFVILYDIAEGEYKDFYQKQYEMTKARDKVNAKWRGVYKQNMEGKGTPWLKGIITSLERSNQFHFPWDTEGNENILKGKRFGAVMYREQFEADDGSRPFATRIYQIRSIEGLKDAEVPEDKLLPERSGRPEPSKAMTPPVDQDGFMHIPEGASDEGIPFL